MKFLLGKAVMIYLQLHSLTRFVVLKVSLYFVADIPGDTKLINKLTMEYTESLTGSWDQEQRREAVVHGVYNLPIQFHSHAVC